METIIQVIGRNDQPLRSELEHLAENKDNALYDSQLSEVVRYLLQEQVMLKQIIYELEMELRNK